MSTIQKVKDAKRDLESEIQDKIEGFEGRHGVEVEHVRLDRRDKATDGSILTKVDLEVSL